MPEKIEDVLNSMFYDDPKDVYGHLVSVLFVYPVPRKLHSEITLYIFSAVTLPMTRSLLSWRLAACYFKMRKCKYLVSKKMDRFVCFYP